MSLKALTDSLRREVAALDLQQTDYAVYRDDPVGFVRDVLGVESATRRSDGGPYQFEILEDLASHARIAVRSGHGVGKSAVDAWAALWWLLTRPLSRVLMVAPTFERQVKAILMSEVRKWVRHAGLPVQVLSTGAHVDGFGDEWAIIGVPATDPDRIEGFHSEGGVLLVLDETKGIGQDVYDALQGALTSRVDSRLLVTSTPGGPAGLFHRVFTKDRGLWRLHHLSSVDSTQVSEDWVQARRDEWGESSPLYQARVLGEFPEDAEGTLLSLGLLEAAVEADGETGPVTLGVDPARFGPDCTAVAVWEGKKLVEVHVRRGLDVMAVASWAHSLANMHGAERVSVDEIGLGAGVVDRLRQLGCRGLTAVNVARAASRKDLFQNLRAELAWQFREALERGEIALPDDDSLLAELSGLRYDYDSYGRIRLEQKDEMRQRIGRSPDRADAAILALKPREEPPSFLWSKRARGRR